MKPLSEPITSPPTATGQHSASGMSPDAAIPDTEAVTVVDDGTGAGMDRSRPLSIPCQECDGEGGWYHYGVGAYDPDSAIRRWVECDECGGAGEFEAERDTECPACLGDGMVTIPKWDVTGKEIECPCCDGYGMIASGGKPDER